jgi:hypothetical protein
MLSTLNAEGMASNAGVDVSVGEAGGNGGSSFSRDGLMLDGADVGPIERFNFGDLSELNDF